MADVYVDQLMSRPVETARPSTPLADAAEKLIVNDIGAVVVVDDAARLGGLLTSTDLVRAFSDGAVPSDTVGEYMRTDVVTTTRSTPVGDVAQLMIDQLIHHVPVVEGDTVVGIITTLDLAAHLARAQ